ncbi:MAG: alpha-1,2-fucosyltransferase [Treponema sp.]|nr:alpha-1,2-fucosyltransferase [Treponema sp.]
MFIVRFNGGLGNQMFQYAFMRALQKHYPNTQVLADLTVYDEEKQHNGFELEKIFGIKLNKATRKDIIRLSNYYPPINNTKISLFLNKVYKKIALKIKNNKKNIIENFYGKDPAIVFNLDENKDYYLDSYWQGKPFYEEALPDLLKEFSFASDLEGEFATLLSDFKQTESVAVHVRRGDYVGSDFDVLSKDYYPNSTKYIMEKFPNAKFFLFSDDPEYCEKEFAFIKNKEIIHGNTASNSYKDMFLMSRCKHNIIANSSFSYWSAVLNQNSEKIIISPDWMSGFSFVNKEWIVIK